MKNILNKTLFKSNKELASKFRDSDGFHYLYNTNLLNIINSMFLIKKSFDSVAFMGPNPDVFVQKLPPGKIIKLTFYNIVVEIKNFIYCDHSENNLIESSKRIESHLANNSERSKYLPKNLFPVLINQDKWPFKENSLDCIINNLSLHNVEDLETHLTLLNSSLIPDGCLLANFFSSMTLNELKFTLGLAEGEREGGVSTNAYSFPHIADLGNLLHKLNLNLPSMNIYKYLYKFDDLSGLFEFLAEIGETNALRNRRPFKRKDTFIAALSLYQNLYNQSRLTTEQFMDTRTIQVDLRNNQASDKFVFSTFEVGSLVCWKYHESQQKPKERGSAEFNLKELATDVLESGKDEIRFGSVQLKDNTEDEFEIIEMTEIIKDKIKKKLGENVINDKIKSTENNSEKNKK